MCVTHDICLSIPKEDIQVEYEKELIQTKNKLSLDNNVVNEEWVNKKSTFPTVI